MTSIPFDSKKVSEQTAYADHRTWKDVETGDKCRFQLGVGSIWGSEDFGEVEAVLKKAYGATVNVMQPREGDKWKGFVTMECAVKGQEIQEAIEAGSRGYRVSGSGTDDVVMYQVYLNKEAME